MSWYRKRIQNQTGASPNDIPQIGYPIMWVRKIAAAVGLDLVTANPVTVAVPTPTTITELDSITVNMSVDLVATNPISVSATATSP
jgi:hypothetical protein